MISFWFTRLQASKAAIKAMIVNRIGDLGLILALGWLYKSVGTVNSSKVLGRSPRRRGRERETRRGVKREVRGVIARFMLVGSIGKSAQLGLHSWLPDAMEGPTPVSALIHAATMVTAGVYLLVRFSGLVEYSSWVFAIIALVGGRTTVFGGSIGLVQNDLKRVVAYSTCSQLGYMIMSCGRSGYSIGMFHLVNHAFFKALLFLGAGSVIHGMSDEQDMRRMGGRSTRMPVTYSMMRIGSLALGGFPFLSGYYSKDLILELGLASGAYWSELGYRLGRMAVCCTSIYSVRLLYRVFWSAPMGYRKVYEGSHESNWVMRGPLLVRVFGARFSGWRLKDRMVGLGSPY